MYSCIILGFVVCVFLNIHTEALKYPITTIQEDGGDGDDGGDDGGGDDGSVKNNPCDTFAPTLEDGAPIRKRRFLSNIITRVKCASWLEWGAYSLCSATCDLGFRSRSRHCNTGHLADCALHKGHSHETVSCNSDPCPTVAPTPAPINGGWSSWSVWTVCSASCSSGIQNRDRTCTHPAPTSGGLYCVGTSVDIRTCNTQNCPLDGAWSTWSNWTECSNSCGTGFQNRVRTCSAPIPSNGGHDCVGDSAAFQKCNDHDCIDVMDGTVDGGWSTWSNWTECSKTCGTGFQNKIRTCSAPTPSHDGQDCVGDSAIFQKCNEHTCIEWSPWRPLGSCSVTCGNGILIYTRSCSSGNNDDCNGSADNIGICQQPACSKWSSWSPTGQCSVTCGNGTMVYTRNCSTGNDQDCIGSAVDIHPCEHSACPEWSSWNPGQCSVTCGNGTMVYARNCSTGNDTDCIGSAVDIHPCEKSACPEWSAWRTSGQCNITCGNGKMINTRTCSTGNDGDCVGISQEITSCERMPCQVDGSWSDWSEWNTCSRSCGTGDTVRTRTCDSPVPANGGADCVGDKMEANSCQLMSECPEWSQWFSSRCSSSCGKGIQDRLRHCSSGHDEDCNGLAFEKLECNDGPC